MITKTDKKVIDFITKYYSNTGFYPDCEEIAKEMEWSSKSTAFLHMRKLENEGIIIRKVQGSAQYRLANIRLEVRNE